MGGESTSPAVEFATAFLAHLNDRDFFVNEGLSLVTADFVRYDKRRITAQPPADAKKWIDSVIELEQLAGEWPRSELRELLAVRGDRLFAVHWVARFGDRAEMDIVTVARVDEVGERFEVLYYFDPEDVDRAIAQLDALQAEIE